jgi:zinc transporter ZupT
MVPNSILAKPEPQPNRHAWKDIVAKYQKPVWWAATWQVAGGLLTPLGAIAGAVLAEAFGLRPTLWLLAIGFAAAAIGLVAARRALPGAQPRN